ncbi:hypothetical protein SAMN05216293_1878 [Flagellimonas taeanensis]|uniref:Uncharacterized protein n=1 Tax=Flagellimonas taeanensis TaxID=1005926 RepID=A0A1M6V3E7_9FLAO|nr:hypothetical protein SAMN05216293_1878 [Allomuricauda taeanensis]
MMVKDLSISGSHIIKSGKSEAKNLSKKLTRQ